MSFITAVVGTNFVSVTTDGRATRNGEIVDENCIKMTRPRDNLVIAYTGIKEACEDIIKTCQSDLVNDSMESIVEKINLRLNSQSYFGTRLSFIIAGCNSQGINQLSTVSNYDTNTNEVADGDKMAIAHSGSKKISDNNERFIKSYETYRYELKNILSFNDIVIAQKKFNNSVADFDFSVNKEIQHIAF